MCQIKKLTRLIEESRNTVFFGGAGVSTESGIPDFRSESGLYAAQKTYGYLPEELLSYRLFCRAPSLFFRYYKENLTHTSVKPNAAHQSLAELERMGRMQAVITQNIDGLHQAAGSKYVLELHGSNRRQYCMGCGMEYGLTYILDGANCKDGLVPICTRCGRIVRPDVVLYGEGLDSSVVQAAVDAISAAALLIVGGTSLAVYPAAGLLDHFNGDNLVLINKAKTPADRYAKLVIHDAIGEVFRGVMELLS